MTLRKNNCFTTASPSASTRSPSTLANSLSFAVSPLSRRFASASPSPSDETDATNGTNGTTVSAKTASERLRSLEQRAESVRQNMHVVELQRDQAVEELGRVKGRLEQVMGELKGFYAREAGRLEDMRVLKESNKRLEEEVKRLDGVALDLENTLSRAEIRLEKYDSGEFVSEKTKDHIREVQERLRATEEGLEASEWRIEDLVYQVGVLRECVLEYEGRVADAEGRARRVEEVLEATEGKYYTVVEESMRRLEGMEGRVRGLREKVHSSVGSGGVGDDGGAGEKMSKSLGPHNGQTKTPGSSVANSSSVAWSRARAHEKKYLEANMELEKTRAENESLQNKVFHLSRDLEAAKEETRESLKSALDRLEDEADAKVAEAMAALELVKEQQAVDLKRMEEDLKAREAREGRAVAEIGELNRALAEEQKATLAEAQEKKRLAKEKEALCGVVEELKRALETVTNKNKENADIVNMSVKSMKGEALRGTPLRSLGMNH